MQCARRRGLTVYHSLIVRDFNLQVKKKKDGFFTLILPAFPGTLKIPSSFNPDDTKLKFDILNFIGT